MLSFAEELQQLFPLGASEFSAIKPDPSQSHEEHTLAIDLAEIENALHDQALASKSIQDALRSVLEFRLAMAQRTPLVPKLDSRIPDEFRLYLHGARAYRLGDHSHAIESWIQLLALLPDQRQCRTTWAAYMLTRVVPEDATERLRALRDCVRKGFSDSLGLAVASLGEEARIALEAGETERAIELYLAQYQSGDPSGFDSLRIVTNRVLKQADRAVLKQLARHPLARRVITAKFLSLSDPTQTDEKQRNTWLDVLDKMAYQIPAEASRLALAAYQNNAMQEASQWLSIATPTDLLAEWLRAKLLLRAGKIDEGREKLEALFADLPDSLEASGVPANERSFRRGSPIEKSSGVSTARIGSENGLLELANGHFASAALCFWKARQWHELAYTAERLLTTEELIDLTAQLTPTHEEFGGRLAHLTARRLTRENRFVEARRFFDEPARALLATYNAQVQQGFDYDASDRDRATSLWAAARLLREHGMTLVATELYPDFAIVDGHFALGDAAESRKHRLAEARLLRIHPTERKRAAQPSSTPYQRFHYRYQAAEWAAHAAQLLPPDDGDAARLLIVAGSWIKQADPETANRYYRQLVIQCGRHPLGQAAEQTRWFPALDRMPFEAPEACAKN